MPTRLVCVANGNGSRIGDASLTVKLVLTETLGQRVEYLAFSHCWGPSPEHMPFQLLPGNVEDCFDDMPFSKMSQNLKDAITITHRLGFSYVWIDSLCIIQGCEEDWTKETNRMGDVYDGAACTIASTGSSSSAGGCFHSRDCLSLQSCKIGVSSLDEMHPSWIYARRDDVSDFERNVDRSPLNARAWFLQERLLSRRIIHFGAEIIYWECCGRLASELNPEGYTYEGYPEDGGAVGVAGEIKPRPPPVGSDPDMPSERHTIRQRKRGSWKNILKPADGDWNADDNATDRAGFRVAFVEILGSRDDAEAALVGSSSFSQTWYEIVESYSKGKLAVPTDKLVALAGIQKAIERATKLTYVNGLWREHLLTDLLWFSTKGPVKRLMDDDANLVAPTWSWASIDGTVAVDFLPKHSGTAVRVREILAQACMVGPDDLNLPLEPTVELEGPLLEIPPPESEEAIWHIDIGDTSGPSARYFPDAWDGICGTARLFCMPFLCLERQKSKVAIVRTFEEDIQGLVLRFVRKHNQYEVYQRVGYFTTSYIKKSREAQQAWETLKKVNVKRIRLTGQVA